MKSYDIATGRIKINIPEIRDEETKRVSEQQKSVWLNHPVTIAYIEEVNKQYTEYIQAAINNAEAGDKDRAVINLIKAKTIKEQIEFI